MHSIPTLNIKDLYLHVHVYVYTHTCTHAFIDLCIFTTLGNDTLGNHSTSGIGNDF
jgi:hypothetical protein